jgi:hypothetical protein
LYLVLVDLSQYQRATFQETPIQKSKPKDVLRIDDQDIDEKQGDIQERGKNDR